MHKFLPSLKAFVYYVETTIANNHHPSMLRHCWLGHVTRKIVPEMTYNVSNGTLNPTILYQYS